MALMEVLPAAGRQDFVVKRSATPEVTARENLRWVERDLEDIVGLTAVAIAQEMRLHDPVSKDAPQEVLTNRKDILDNVAARAMIDNLNTLDRTIYMSDGEGAKDILENGQEIEIVEGVYGRGGPEIEGIDDALELTTAAAREENEATSAVAISEPGGFIKRPEGIHRMSKLFAPFVADLSLDDPAIVNMRKVLNGLQLDNPKKLRVTVLNRPQNQKIIEAAQELGLDLDLVEGGDLLPATVVGEWKMGEYGQMVYTIGGGWPEGVIGAAALKANGRAFVEARPYHKDPEIQAANNQKLGLDDLVPGDANKTFVVMAHVTDDPKYVGQPGVQFYQTQRGELAVVAVTTIDHAGRRQSNIIQSLR